MHASQRLRICAMAALMAAAAVPAFALPWTNFNGVRDAPMTKFNAADTKLMTQTLYRTLSSGEDGVTVSWSNPATTSGGSITPAKDPKGRAHCRLAQVENHFRDMRGDHAYIFCKSDGKTKGAPPWQLVSPWPA
jgi:surface antigen